MAFTFILFEVCFVAVPVAAAFALQDFISCMHSLVVIQDTLNIETAAIATVAVPKATANSKVSFVRIRFQHKGNFKGFVEKVEKKFLLSFTCLQC